MGGSKIKDIKYMEGTRLERDGNVVMEMGHGVSFII